MMSLFEEWQSIDPTSMQPMPSVIGTAPESHPTQSAALRLRGLPFTATEQDVLAFFAKHDVVQHVAEVEKAVKMITKASGKPSGQAIVHMVSKEAAATVQEVLDGQWISSRYIEVFQYSEGEDDKASNGATKGAVENGGTGATDNNTGMSTIIACPPQALPGQTAPGTLQGQVQHSYSVGDTGGSGGGLGNPAVVRPTPMNFPLWDNGWWIDFLNNEAVEQQKQGKFQGVQTGQPPG